MPATEDDCEGYAQTIGAETFPVFADGDRGFANATPMTQNTHPEMCAITPSLEIIECFSGHGGYFSALDAVKAHAGL